jgi:dGTP triphosphohydrolase
LEAGIVTPLDFMSIDDGTLEMIEKDVQKGLAKRGIGAEISTSTIFEHLSDVFGTLLDWGQQDKEYRFENKVDRLAFVGRTYAESILHGKSPLVRRQFLETLIEQNIDAIYIDFDPAYPFLSKLRVDKNRLILIESMKAFNFHKVISSRRLQLQHARNRKIIGDTFDTLVNDRHFTLFSDFQRERLEECHGDDQKRMRLIADIVSSLTDIEALNLYDQLNSTRNTRFWSYTR